MLASVVPDREPIERNVGDRGSPPTRTLGTMVRPRLGFAAALMLTLALSACAEASPPSGVPSSGPDQPIDLRYTCGGFSFGAGLLDVGPGTDELANDPAAAALRAHLAGGGPDIDFLPDTGWHRTGQDARTAEFVAVGGDIGVIAVSLENVGGGWKVTGWGDCQPRLELADGLGPAEWAFDSTQPQPGPATQVFDALVTEMNCNSGQPADGRIVGPRIVVRTEDVLVIFAVRPRPGGQRCPSNPSTRVTVDLGEPLGQRVLLDGGRLPPGDPTKPRF